MSRKKRTPHQSGATDRREISSHGNRVHIKSEVQGFAEIKTAFHAYRDRSLNQNLKIGRRGGHDAAARPGLIYEET
jgi:hypothetical protein